MKVAVIGSGGREHAICVSLKKSRVLQKNCHWIYYSSKNIIFNRVSEHKLMSKFVSPSNKTYLTCEISYSKNDYVDSLDFKKISEIVSQDLVKVGLIKKVHTPFCPNGYIGVGGFGEARATIISERSVG